MKKTPRADLENKRSIFFLVGLVVALALVLAVLEWNTTPSRASDLGQIECAEVEEEIIPITREREIKPPPPPPKVVEVLNIVDDDVEIEDEIEIEDTEADDETFIDVTPVVVKETVVEEEEEDKVWLFVGQNPEFPGGERALMSFINRAVRYPVIAQENGIQGTVYVNFVVGKDGSVYRATVTRGVDPSLDKEALRVINSLPQWKPGMQQGKPVNVSYNSRIRFELQ